MATTTAAAPPAQLTANGLDKAKADSGFSDPLVLRVSEVTRVNEAKWTAVFSDGTGSRLSGVLTTQAIQRLQQASGKQAGGGEALADGDVVRVSSYSCISHANQMRLMAMSVEVLHRALGAGAGVGGAGGNASGNGNGNSAGAPAGGGGAPASPADGGAGGKDQVEAAAAANNNPVTPARPATADGGVAAANAAGAVAYANAPPAPTPGEQPRLTPGSLAAAGLTAAGGPAAASPGPPPPTAIAPNRAAAVAPPPANNNNNANASNATNPNSTIPVRAAGRPEPAGVVPIASLNPYESGCTIKAKVVRKNPMRSFSRGGGGGGGASSSSVFSCELADAQGGSIQATFWREAAERVHASLQEGRVYYFSRFSVKPSNKAYSAVRNDYELSFDPRGCEVEEAADQQASAEAVAAALKESVDAVPLARLVGHVGRKAPVDVLALVLQVGPMGSVKRKADNAELARRDLVLGDATGRSVVLTVWNALASSAALDEAAAAVGGGGGGGGKRPMVLQVTNVRVGDYNGCSLSTVTRSELTAEPQSAEADALREWWDTASAQQSGAPPAFSPLGAASAAGGGGADGAAGGSRRNKITSIAEMLVPRGQEPAPDAKPTYCTVLGHIAHINADKDLYYLASAENGRKVVRQADGRLWCEGDGKFVEAAEHRYIFLARVEDESGEAYLNVFNNDGARLLGGKSADELAAMRVGSGEEGGGAAEDGGNGEDALRRVLKGAQWTPWVFTVQCKSREYNGERRMRYSVMSAAPVDFREQAARMLAALNEM